MDSKEEICPVCGNTSYENQDGHYYCLECGTQSQVIADFEKINGEFSLPK